MAFSPAKFNNKSNRNVADLRYALRQSTSSAKSFSVQVSITRELAAKAGIAPDAGIRLDFDEKRNLGRILPIASEKRAFRAKGCRLALIAHWPHNGQVAKFFPKSEVMGCHTIPLVVSEVSKDEGVIFELPARS